MLFRITTSGRTFKCMLTKTIYHGTNQKPASSAWLPARQTIPRAFRMTGYAEKQSPNPVELA